MFTISKSQAEQFAADGLLICEDLIDDDTIEQLRDRYERLFRGEFETGAMPDEINWQEGKSDETLTRQICNGWKADRTVARVVFREDFGRAIADLMGWPGTRVMIDNVLWKPVGARSLGYHQDNAYLHWFNPGTLCSLWIALDDTSIETGAMELVRGSRAWQPSEPDGEFHGPKEYRAPMERAAAREGADPDIVYVAVKKGCGSIHHGWTWHGSGPNTGTTPRRSLVLHAMSSEACFNPDGFGTGTGPIYCRYKRFGDDEIDENFFPVIYRQDGYRTPGIDAYCGTG
jgi:ectoine hydroxylase-related dioxygenase (phytanoyl-CoA dioxygenase family)